jgi:hypothetical protein
VHEGEQVSDTDAQCPFGGRRSEVVAWTLATEALDPRRMTALEAMLDLGERARARRFAFTDDRRDFVAAHGLFKKNAGAVARAGAEPISDVGSPARSETAGDRSRMRRSRCQYN